MIKELITKLYIKFNPDMTCILKETLDHYKKTEQDYLACLYAESVKIKQKHNIKKYIVAQFIDKEFYNYAGKEPNTIEMIKRTLASKFTDAIIENMNFYMAGQDDRTIRYEATITLVEDDKSIEEAEDE